MSKWSRPVDHDTVEAIRSAFLGKQWEGQRVSDLELANQYGVSEHDVAFILGPIKRSNAKTQRKLKGRRR